MCNTVLLVTIQVGETQQPPSRAGDVNPLPSPRARAFHKFSMNLLNVGQMTQRGRGGLFTVGLSEPIYVSHVPGKGP